MRPGVPNELVFVPFDFFLLKVTPHRMHLHPLATRSPKAEALEFVFIVAPARQDFDA